MDGGTAICSKWTASTEESEVEFWLTPSSERTLQQRRRFTTVFEYNSGVFHFEDVDHIPSMDTLQHKSFISPKWEGLSYHRSLSPSTIPSNIPNKQNVPSGPRKEICGALLDMRNKLLLKLGYRWALPRHVLYLNWEVIYRQQLEVTVGCTFHSFHEIANNVRTFITDTRSLSVHSFDARLCGARWPYKFFHIYLHSLWNICEFLDILDPRPKGLQRNGSES